VRRENKIVDGKLRKYYRLTARGRTYLKAQKRRLMELVGEALTADELQVLLEKRIARRGRHEGAAIG
jgi:DNA-binding PadR family transcriptional regulator